MKEAKSVLPFMAPFFKATCVYFILDFEEPTLLHAIIKILPILCLIFFVYWIQHGSSTTGGGDSYGRLVLLGLILCCCGDFILIWQSVDELYFLTGMILFLFGHMAYVHAFGFRPFGLKEFILCVFVCSFIYCTLYPTLPSPVMTVAIAVYTAVIGAMAWRALARFNLKGDIPWRKIFAAVGALSFVASDTILAVNKFMWRFPCDKEVIMLPYYIAQMGIAMSVINTRIIKKEL